ncbi:MAG: hypothetical protein JXB17_06590 [Bacteroidales bacterium]|nr:hypothetical protein [Bacteroidales bacterium]
MKTINFLLSIILLSTNIYSQNSQSKLKVNEFELPYLTLSDGRYDEIHQYNNFERVGSAIIDMKTHKVIRFVNKDSIQDVGMYEMDMTTRFLTIDPLAEKYVQLNPYGYCANNPILFIDPNGEEIWIYYGEDNANRVRYENGNLYDVDGNQVTVNDIGNDYVSSVVGSLGELGGTKTGEWLVGELQNTDLKYNISYGEENTANPNFNDIKTEDGVTSSGGNITYNGDGFISLGHEMAHGFDMKMGYSLDMSEILDGIPLRERRACHIENILRSENEMPLRQYYFSDDPSKSNNPPLLNAQGREIIHNYDYSNPNVERNYKTRVMNTLFPLKPIQKPIQIPTVK